MKTIISIVLLCLLLGGCSGINKERVPDEVPDWTVGYTMPSFYPVRYSSVLCKNKVLQKNIINLLSIKNTNYICFNNFYPNYLMTAADTSGYRKINWNVYEI
ncbi:hypothetical protein C0W35_21640 [Photobacterium kishitanii]|uniref:hypothetical protein n=1 Tax=Photobacterium kishitanii TaxID=318456 RepID=UPI000D4B25A6|nr:hypothetical protein [Photobacterium kishitanii]PSU87483.1 hypothetical protein C0W35_21640 [Photobacterium kishitanii]